MKDENPIEEIWRIRAEIGAEHGYDVDRLFAAMRELNEKINRLSPEDPSLPILRSRLREIERAKSCIRNRPPIFAIGAGTGPRTPTFPSPRKVSDSAARREKCASLM